LTQLVYRIRDILFKPGELYLPFVAKF